MTDVDMSNDKLFTGWYQYEQFPNGAASRWCSENGTVKFECDDPSVQAVGIFISTVGKFNKARLTVKSGRKIVGKIEIEPEVGAYYIPITASEFLPGNLSLNIKCWDEREFVSDPRTLGLFVDKIWTDAPGVASFLRLLWDDSVTFSIKGDAKDTGIMPCIIGSGYWETATQMVIDRFVKDTDVCLDIGANIGAIAMPLANRAEKVIAVEVGSIPFGFLKRNILANKIDNIELIKGGVSDTEGTLYYYYTYPNVGGSFISDRVIENSGAIVEEIKTFPLDNLVDDLEKVDFIKMDIEGHELIGLNGAKKLLKKFKPKLFIEFNPVAFKQIHDREIKPLWDFLRKEYEYIYIVRDDGLKLVKTYSEAVAGIDLETRTLEDFLCVHEELEL